MNCFLVHRLKLLGGSCLEARDGSLPPHGTLQRHRLALLALLAVTDRGLTRDKLIGYLWPEREARAARNLLNVSVYVVRTALGEESLVSSGDELRLNRELVATDVVEFDRAIREGAWEIAVGLYAGPFLDGFFLTGAREFELWADRQRDRLTAAYAGALEALARAAEAAADPVAAARWWRMAVSHDPFDSRLTLRLMQALEAAGNRAGAVGLAGVHAALLRREFGMAPTPDLVAFAQRLQDFPGGEGASRQPHQRSGSRGARPVGSAGRPPGTK